MVIGKAGHHEITMVIAVLKSDVETCIHSGFFGGVGQILWQQLTLFVKVVRSPLFRKVGVRIWAGDRAR